MASRALLAIPALILALVTNAPAEEGCCDPAGPFRPGEAYPETLATCDTLGHWADRAPKTDDRITLGIEGAITGVHSDGVMAYLLMCAPAQVQVMCVTYSANDLKRGDVMVFGGGYSRVDAHHVVLDPCLASAP
ncbi:hypothetical protein EV667_0688 [Ancylobacter aquaticus]|uniref:Uncharacterized protein n=1 Tax=Ancylobacter aquaticus TaxID=100 RepID=A0A4V2PK07_ANCAQ|nr:hypothetical protein [Ancylobacter aquaticus]TCK30596.1 hypothetical protein EV667_0688 [Ancylobacter aquaticus]